MSKRILITGGNGFIGGHLSAKLSKDKNYDIAIFDKDRTPINDCQYIRGDITDYYSISDAFSKFNPDTVIHLAGMVSRRECEETPHLAIQSNVMGTHNICELCTRFNARLIYSGSSEEYGTAFYHNVIDEETPFGKPTGMYSLTKRMAEEVIQYKSEKGLLATTLRFFMFYGPGELPTPYRSAIARFVNDALNDRPLKVHLRTSRAWCYIDDAIDAIERIIEHEQVDYETYNIGSSSRIETEVLAHRILKLTDSKSKLMPVMPDETIIFDKIAQFNKMHNTFKWRATTSLENGLRNVIEFQRKKL